MTDLDLDFGDLRAIFINCTLKRSTGLSHRAERVVVGHQTLGPEGRQHRGVQAFGKGEQLGPGTAGALADHEHRPPRLVEQSGGPGDVVVRGTSDTPPVATVRQARGRVAGLLLDLVGQDEVGDPAPVHGVLHRERRQLGVVGAGLHRRGRHGDVAEDGGQVEVLEGAPAAGRRRHLSGDRDHRRPVEPGVVQARDEVGRPRTGDREAGSGAAGQLPVGAGREGRCSLVADADVAHLSPLLGPAQGVGEAEVGVADHPEDRVHPVRDQRLDEDVGDGAVSCGRDREPHVGPVAALVDVVRRDGVAEALRRLAAGGVVVVAVPGTAQPAVLDGPLADGSSLVGAPVLQRPQPPAAPGQRDGPSVDPPTSRRDPPPGDRRCRRGARRSPSS
ncbi:hypothetical protein BJ958_003970 [Nocardioides kongjuensis]|uniref:Uncharacterized protein n=1 Tax=Nocardioides kongjuensis TaxID=349522 RepID=A0A852RX35_9ACTN|nr:hypothetical protein [Nocardioides kongjuensis]NYD32424.1 hypothetical protein [Nocardioides kongjuensis]